MDSQGTNANESFQLSSQDHEAISEFTQKLTKLTQTLTTSTTYDLVESYDMIFSFYSVTPKPFDSRTHRFLAQLSRIYDLSLRMLCTKCGKLYNTCTCRSKTEKVEFNCKLLIDDHTGLLKVTYRSDRYDLNDKHSIFHKISGPLLKLLKHAGHVSIPHIPKSLYVCETKSVTNNTQSYDNRLDQVLCDFLSNCVLNSYFIFEIRPNHSRNFLKTNGLTLVNSSNVNDRLMLSKTVYEADCINFTSITSAIL